MCGIAGIISLSDKVNLEHHSILDMCDAQKHRGPDGEGYLFSSDFTFDEFEKLKLNRPNAHLHVVKSKRKMMLGHRRLSIIDLNENAFQPMPDSENKIWIVYNGEIYNHRSIRSELEQLGHQFYTDHSDTEVIINSYKQWGINCLEKFRGMFAFVLFDLEQDLFFVVRDRLGVKPLYYAINGRKFYFGSELKVLFQSRELKRKINYDALNEYFTFNCVSAPNTLFEGIHKVKPAHYIVIKNGVVGEQTCFWNLEEKANLKSNLSDDELAKELLSKFSEAVNIRREGDVGYGALLSGGVDSSANVSVLSSLVKSKIETFTVGFKNINNNYKNEFEYAQKVADLFQTNHHEIELTEDDYLDFINKMSFHFDEPIADTACIPIYFVSRLAKENGITILLGGEGSDEFFIGYQLWRFNNEFFKTIGTVKNKFILKQIQKILNLPYIKSKRKFYSVWIERLLKNQPTFWGGTEIVDDNTKEKYYTGSFKEKTKAKSTYSVIEGFYNQYSRFGNSSLYDFMSVLDSKIRLPELLLSRLDKMTMAASVEAREPFMDYKLVEFAMSLDDDKKVRNNTEKYLLKKAFSEILPEEIVQRPKDGFTVPLHQLFANEKLRKMAITKITEFNTYEKIFEPEYIHLLFDENKYTELWQLFAIALWWDSYIINSPFYVDEKGNIIPEFKS